MRVERLSNGWVSRWLLAGALAGALACGVKGATVTFTLSLDDDGTGPVCAGLLGHERPFAIYADVSADNEGLFAFRADLQGNINTLYNMAPQATYSKPSSPTKYAGFSVVQEDVSTGKIAGLPDLAKGTNLIPVYGFGQSDGDMRSVTPSGYTYNDNNFNAAGPVYKAHFLLGKGTYQIASPPSWDTSSVDNAASVYVNRTGTSNAIAQVNLDTTHIIADCFDNFGFNFQPLGANQAVGGAITVSGSNHNYISEVDQLLDPSSSIGSAPIQTIGDEAGNLYVMAKVVGDASAVASVLSEFNNGSADPQAARLHAIYDSQFGSGGFNLLYKQQNFAGPKFLNWDFILHSGAVIDQLAVVPEPGMGMIVFLSGVMLLSRKQFCLCYLPHSP